jgi:hypothetical protein
MKTHVTRKNSFLEACRYFSPEAVCVTTNGVLKNNGALVMGAGVAKEFRDTFSGIDFKLGELVRNCGNNPYVIPAEDVCASFDIISFPTKNNWADPSDMDLIISSARKIVAICDENNYEGLIVLPAAGCGNGGLKWDDVFQNLKDILDDRFMVILKDI